MTAHRAHSIEFKRQVVQEFLSGEMLHGLARRHELARNLIRIWIQKYEAGAFDEDVVAAETMQTYEARIAALERLGPVKDNFGRDASNWRMVKSDASAIGRTSFKRRPLMQADRAPA